MPYMMMNRATNEISKESHVSKQGQMVDKNGHAVQAAELISYAGLYDLPKLDVKTLVNTKKVICSLDNGEDSESLSWLRTISR